MLEGEDVAGGIGATCVSPRDMRDSVNDQGITPVSSRVSRQKFSRVDSAVIMKDYA